MSIFYKIILGKFYKIYILSGSNPLYTYLLRGIIMIIFIQILIITSTFISCWFSYTNNYKDEIQYAFKDWKSYPYTGKLTDAEIERMMGKPKNIIDIDYDIDEIDNGNTVYFEIIPIEPIQKSKIKKFKVFRDDVPRC